MIKHVIFDFDGVLVDSEIIANRLAVEMKAEHGIQITLEEQLLRFTGLAQNHPDMLEEMKRLPAGFMDAFKKRVRLKFIEELTVIDGAIDLLEGISLPKCVASGSEPESLAFKLAHTGLTKYFGPHTFSSRMVKHGKPAPDLFLFAADKLGWKPGECLVIEDSLPGVQAGVAAGMTVCGFTGAGHIRDGHAENLRAAGAHFVVPGLREVLKLLEQAH
jgi:HAD superfamily hydrolase (TIGR01509 family)